jgi:ABC-2 type transport system ATP-binding protein
MIPALRTERLSKHYRGGRRALSDVTLTVPAGRVVGLVGPNGAGKSTLLNLIAGTIRPTSGTIEVLGTRPAANAAQLDKVGFVAQDTPVYAGLTVAEHLRLGAKLNANWDARLAQRRIVHLGLDPAQKAGRLSGGQRAQLALAVATAKRPQLLVFDEPVAALDPLARRTFLQNLMESVAELEATVILSSHLLGDLERVCDHLVILTAHYRLVDRPGQLNRLPPGVEIIQAEHNTRQSTLIVRDTSGMLPRLLPELLPTATPLELEDMVLAYLNRAVTTPAAPDARQPLEVPR